jgi:hypothetical protein
MNMLSQLLQELIDAMKSGSLCPIASMARALQVWDLTWEQQTQHPRQVTCKDEHSDRENPCNSRTMPTSFSLFITLTPDMAMKHLHADVPRQ